ncbi:hypothetical protein PMZ80_006252 [Knufia obscura]|uniref:Nephrocystin 3-like N-terminal domain-containing protein n=1 Tax=Knufia obscura TaxID=1635080 RepID=A0ABR0RK68_9EURO|nr:hypothetical protein PMZ80_006252 [Knufia obscura]
MTQKRILAADFDGSLHYKRVDVQDAKDLDWVISEAAAAHGRMDGLIAAAGVQNVVPALEYPPEKIGEMMNINYTGVYLSAVACAKQMIKYKTPGAMCLIGSMSGLIANKGFTSSVYNSSKAAVIQLARSLAMEWGIIKEFEGMRDSSVAGSQGWKRGIRVNVLCPGNIMTPMVRKNFEDDPELRAIWERENMMGRISEPEEYRGAALFMLSDASSFMTGSHLVVDGGYTAWVDVQEEEDAVVIPYNGEQPLAVSSWQHRNLQRSQNGNDQLDYLPSETGHPTRQRGQNDGRVYNGTVVDGYGVVQQGDNHGTIQVNNYHTLAKPTKEEEEKRLFEILLGSLAKDLDMDARLRNVKIAMNQTCQWLFRHKHFRTWSSQDPLEEYNPFLRITGKPGCGKSTLMKTALTYVDEQWDQSWCTVSYFFNARATEELEKSSLGLYRSLVHQIVSKNSQLETGFRQAFRSKVKSDVVTAWAETELQNYLIDILRSDESLRLCLFIDALDEGSEDDVRDLVAFCEELVACAKEPQEAIRIYMVDKYILDRSRGLLEVSGFTIQFIHETVREFLIDSQGLCRIDASLASNISGSSHELLKLGCLNYISACNIPDSFKDYGTVSHNVQELRMVPTEVESVGYKFPFMEYACGNIFLQTKHRGTIARKAIS